MKVAVIGSNSFSGSHFIDHLLINSEYDIIGISRSPEKEKIFLPYKQRNLSRFAFFQHDLNKDLDNIFDLLDKKKPEYVVNFASQSIVAESWLYPEDWYRTNVMSTVAFVNRLKDRTYLKKYVHISTPEVYGSCTGSVKEDHPFNPSTPYAASRACADKFIQLLVRQYKFPAVFTRAANVYGPGQQLFKIIPKTIMSIKKGMKIPLHGGGYARRSFIYIEDVSSATKLVMEKGVIGEVYHISTDELISIRDLVEKICDMMGVDFKESVKMVETRPGLDDAYVLDSTRMKRFGWESNISLKQGINKTIDWINNEETLLKLPLEYIHKK